MTRWVPILKLRHNLPLFPVKRKAMPRQKYCADNLYLFGEMLDVAAQYIGICDDVLNEEDKPMVELAYGQIHPLKDRTDKLGRKLEELEKRVRNKLVELSERTPLKGQPKRHAARAT
jgi:hypothetical protein